MSILLYRVLAASGGYVNGEEVAIGALVPLTIEEARYEVDSGAVEATGLLPNLPPSPAVIQAGDLVLTRRGIFDRNVDVAALEAFFTRNGGVLAAFLATRADEIAVLAAAAADRQIGSKATPADIAAAIAPLATALAGKATPANITAAVQPLATALAGKATLTDIASAVQPIASALAGKATPADIASAIQPVAATLARKADTAVLQAIAVAILDAVDASKLDRAVPAYASRAAALAAIAPGTMRIAEVDGCVRCLVNRAGVLIEPFVIATNLDA